MNQVIEKISRTFQDANEVDFFALVVISDVNGLTDMLTLLLQRFSVANTNKRIVATIRSLLTMM